MDDKLETIVGIGLIMFGIIEVVCFCHNTNKDNNITDGKEQQHQVTNINNSNVDTLRVKTFSYNNHKYIKFTSGNESWCVHDPDCQDENK